MIPEGSKTPDHSGKRIRASESAVSAVLRAMTANGIAVGKICITGGQVEIIAAGVEEATQPKKSGGPKDW
ncbi:hypothetical protein HHL25_03005 [Rhizobium sp. S-51]|uniref:Uncharacterized protein n=1 Tax=Rhizobium terricola TaxID=2728849 RepID=A0A7Y0ATD3_9HYPH|nr:hypothetical protein [Rhizobium terricola]NML73088.1 hypothetical protein [Rhizobium terricola]